jgi:peptide/nickel transport system permease protein
VAFLVKRLAGAALVVFGAVTLVFLVLNWLPGDPALLIAGEDAPASTVEHVRAQLGSDRPLWEQYTHCLGGLAKGDLGVSFATGESVASRLAAQVPATLELTLLAALLALALGIVLGVVSAVHQGRWIDHAIQSTTLVLTSMPSFWLGILLILVFSVDLRWLPVIGSGDAAQLVLPVACLGLATSGRLGRMVRNNVLDVVDEPFVATLRGKGLLEGAVLYRHVLRSALIPVITMLGLLVGELLGGTVVIETLFARQGLGRLISESISAKDIPMIQGAVLFASIIFVLINLLVDLSYRWVDPRIEL